MSEDVITLTTVLERHGTSLAAEVARFTVVDQASFSRGADLLRGIKVYLGKVAEVLDPVIRAAHQAHKTAVDQKRKLDAPALDAERRVKQTMAAYEQEQARLQREAEVAAQRERERVETEAKAVAKAEAARLQALAEEERLQRALEAEARGDTAVAEKLLDAPLPEIVSEPIVVFTPPPAVEVPQADGISFREQWRAEVTDFALLVKAVASGDAPLTILKVDQPTLNAMARALKGALTIPGVRPVMERVAAVRT